MRVLVGPEINNLIEAIGKLPGLGPRSARRAALHLLKMRSGLMVQLTRALTEAARTVVDCRICGAYDTTNPCAICVSPERDASIICVVQDLSDLWAMERAGVFGGLYHVLGGVLSALDGVGPEDLTIERLIARAQDGASAEIVLALGATVDGQTTAYYILDALETLDVKVTALAHGLPVGGEVGALDDGTIAAALSSRRPL